VTIQTPQPRQPPRQNRLGRDRRGAIAVIMALLALPLIMMVGLAIDYATYSQTNAALTAAARAAVLNAVKVAAAGAAAGSSTYVQDGQNAGNDWYLGQSGKTGLTVSNMSSNGVIVAKTGGAVTATLTGTAQAASIFGAIIGIKTYNIAISAQAQQTIAPYAEVIMLLDNSSSMGTGATATDIATLMKNSPCDPSNYYTSTNGTSWSPNVVYVKYANYACTDGGTYDGQNSPWNTVACPFANGYTTYTYSSQSPTYQPGTNVPSNAQFWVGSNFTCPTKVNGYATKPGPPCAFACHSDGSKAAGSGADLWAMARKNGVTLRSDLVKNAAQQLITNLTTRDPNGTALSLGVYAFATGLYRIYPAPQAAYGAANFSSGAEAGNVWSAASTAVGFPPTSGSYTETGIQPAVAIAPNATSPAGNNNNNTNFTTSMSNLASSVTASGSGATAAAPRKVLFLITDGMDDESDPQPTGTRGVMPSSSCKPFKDMGYTVYVIYTPYYPLMDQTYLSSLMSIVEGTGTSSIAYALQQCSSSTGASDLSTYYIRATDQASLTNGLQSFLTSALSVPAFFTQ
jgi:Flp pilus assembly protein TadG